MQPIILIAAVADNNVIGNNGKLPWHIPDDFKLFKDNTSGNTVVMGRRTFESIGRPLPNRNNIVVSSTLGEQEGITVCKTLDEALEKARKFEKKIFIIGGARMYKEAMPIADKLYISHVSGKYEGDTFFPDIDLDKWRPARIEGHKDFKFVEYVRICDVQDK